MGYKFVEHCLKKAVFNLFHATVLFLLPLKHQKTSGFLMFSGGIERDQWLKQVNKKIRTPTLIKLMIGTVYYFTKNNLTQSHII